jgi:hypothetical protein
MKKSIHAMTSKVASDKKKDGHAREVLRSELLGPGAIVISGTGKPDIVREDGKTETVKGGKKTQWALYTLNRVVSDNTFSVVENEVLTQWVNFLPDDKKEWEINRSKYKVNPHAELLVDTFKETPMKLVNYFCGVNIVDMLVTLDSRDNTWMETPMCKFSKKISEAIKSVYFTKGGKLVIKGGNKNIILFEMEIRKGNGSHKRILFHSHIHRIIDCLK